MIDISSYPDNGDSFEQLKANLLSCLGNMAFGESAMIICFHLLKCIKYEFVHNPGIHEDDIIKGCNDVKEMIIKQFGVWEESIPLIKEPSVFEIFLFNLLNFEKLPGKELQILENKIKDDCKSVMQPFSFTIPLNTYKSLKKKV